MAFENINWGMIPSAKRADQQMLMQAIGQGIGAYERGQDRQLKQRQLDMQAQKAPNLKNQYEMEVTKAAMGMPYDKNLINAYEATKTGVPVYDPITKQMVMGGKPDALSALGIGLGDPNKVTQQTPQQDLQLDNSPEAISNAMGVSVDDLRAAQGNVSTYQPAITDKVLTPEEFETYKAGGVLKGTPAGSLMEEESRQKAIEQMTAEKIKQQFKNINLADFSDGQLNSANYANMMRESSDIIKSLPKDAQSRKLGAVGGIDFALNILPFGMGEKLGDAAIRKGATPEQRRYLNAADAWIRAKLRDESGAVIGEEEMKSEYETFFPVYGDKEEEIKQKTLLRNQAEKGMIGKSAGAYQKMFGKKGQAVQGKQTGAMSWEEYFK